MLDPYKVLGVSPSATADEIKAAYRKKAKEYHPDLHPNDKDAAKKMDEVNQAYDMLKNPEQYRARMNNESTYSSSSSNGGEYRDFEDIFSEFVRRAAQNANNTQNNQEYRKPPIISYIFRIILILLVIRMLFSCFTLGLFA